MRATRVFSSLSLVLCFFSMVQAQPAQTWQTGQTTSYASGDDGDLQRGVSWPVPRFEENGDGTITDHLTGLIWLKNANCFGAEIWSQALVYCNNLASGSCGLSDVSVAGDWRLPNRKELLSLIDYSRYNPALPPGHLFDNLPPYYNWSATTLAARSNEAWLVSMITGYMAKDSKSGEHYVWPVRDSQIKFLDHFNISNIDSPQSENTPFEITITARDDSNSLISSFNGNVNLSSCAPLSPTSVDLANGTWTGPVILFAGGSNISIEVSGYGVSGQSNLFSTSNIGVGNLGGTVTDNRNNHIEGADVFISESLEGPVAYLPIQTNASGQYIYQDISEGTYYIWAEHQGKASHRLFCVVSKESTTYFRNIVIPVYTSSKTPVMLVPGFPGSTLKGESEGLAPRLKRDYAKLDELELFEKFGMPGWKNLKNYLIDNKGLDRDTTIIECPWDWRRPLEVAYKEYLIKALDRAKKGDPHQKVNIIAHSMGGLLVRQYIQSNEYANRNDIENFTMVGTPNKGSANAYYIWEGGDPKRVDRITGGLYYQYISALFTGTYNAGILIDSPLLVKRHGVIREFVQNNVPSLRQLLPTYEFLHNNKSGNTYAISTPNNINTYLYELNSNPKRYERMGPPGTTNKIETRLYFSDSKHTIGNIEVKPTTTYQKPFPYDFYADGKPIADPEGQWELPEIGDETVPGHSAMLPCDPSEPEEWAECIPVIATHTTLIRDFYQLIADNLYDDVAQPALQNMGDSTASEASTLKLLISYNGRVQPRITDPQARVIGVNFVSGSAENEVPSGIMKIEPDIGLITINDPIDGNYELSLKSLYSEDYTLSIALMTANGEFIKEFTRFDGPGLFSVTFSLLSADQIPIIINHQPGHITGLIANAVDLSGLKTYLYWDESTDVTVTGYKIYGRDIDEPFMEFIGSSVVPSYNTGDPWAGDSTLKKRLYAVAAIKNDGSESFLSAMVTNDDRDHDGLEDETETTIGTFLNDVDSDNDGYEDGEEIWFDTNPLDSQNKPCMANFDGDEDVDETDLVDFANGFGQAKCQYCYGDFYQDNDVDGTDLVKFAFELGRTDCP